MSKTERFNWIVIYLNIPLWIAVGVLWLVFHRWDIAQWLVIGNVVVLIISLSLGTMSLSKYREETKDGTP